MGLAVDYSAHIAHMFVESTGTGAQRAIAALERIGPSVSFILVLLRTHHLKRVQFIGA